MTCHALHQSRALEIVSCVGDAARREPVERRWPSFEAHFQDDGAYFLHDGTRTVLVDVHHVELRLAGVRRVYSRPVVSVDRGTSIRVSSDAADSLVSRGPCGQGGDVTSGVVRVGPRAFHQLRALRRALKEPSRNGEGEVEQRAMSLLASLMRAAHCDASASRSPRPATVLRHRDAVERAKEFLAVRSHTQSSLAQVASVVDYAPHHFARVFRHETGMSVHQYLTELRLRQAAARLDEGADNLSSLALDLGFSSHSHFTTAFRARFGCTPGAYRR